MLNTTSFIVLYLFITEELIIIIIIIKLWLRFAKFLLYA